MIAAFRPIEAILAAGLAVASSTASLHTATQRDELIARWASAQQHAVNGISDRKGRAAAAHTFAAERREMIAPASPSAGVAPPPDIAALAQDELKVPGRYRLSEAPVPAAQRTWWQRLWSWIGDRWADFFKSIFGRARISPEQAGFIGDVLVALFAFVVLVVAWRLVAAVQFERRKRARAVEFLASEPQAQELYARACRCAEAGEYGIAAKLLFAATLAELGVRGDVRELRSATVGDLRSSLRSRDASLVPSFDAIARPFVASAYAERAVRRDEWQSARDAYALLAPGDSR